MSNIQAEDRSEGPEIERNLENRDASLASVHAALEAAYGKKALDPVLLEVGAMCSYAEFVLLLSGRSDRQVDAIADAVIETMKASGARSLGVEGRGSGQWVLVDFGDVVIHVFHHPLRQHYNLESLWIDAPHIELEVPEDARIPADEYY